MQTFIDSLRIDLKNAILSSPDDVLRFWQQLSVREGEEKIYNEFALQVMEDFNEQDGYLVASFAAKMIEKCDDGSSRERVRKIRENLTPLPGLRDYRSEYDVLIRVLESKKLEECFCQAKTSAVTPPSEYPFHVLESFLNEYGYPEYEIAQCKICKTRFKVESDMGYHFTVYHWQKI